MAMTPEEIRKCLAGTASESMNSRFLQEIQDPQSEASEALRARARRAGTILGPGSPVSCPEPINYATQISEMLQEAARLTRERDYNGALTLRENAVDWAVIYYGEWHRETATCVNALALVLHLIGDYPAARDAFEKAVAIRSAVMGSEHSDTGISLAGLGRTLEALGEYHDAIKCHERALAISEKELGANSPDTGVSLSEAHAQNKFKTNLFARGFESGDRASVGCSIKGRLWSFRVAADIGEWVAWCRETGSKLQNEMINPAEVLKGAMIPKTVTERPRQVPVAIEWSEDLLNRSEDGVQFEFAGQQVPLCEAGLSLVEHNEDGPIRFRVTADKWPRPAEYEVRFGAERVDYVPLHGADLVVVTGRRKRPLAEYLQDESPVIVQPGLMQSTAESGQLDLLSVTELYLRETFGAELHVIASK